MENAVIKTLKDSETGELLAPRTDAKAVRFDSAGTGLQSVTVEAALKELEEALELILSGETGETEADNET